MRLPHPIQVTLMTLSLSAALIGVGHGELSTHPLLLRVHGSYIELTERSFRRADAIQRVRAEILVHYVRDKYGVLSESYPLSAKGIAEFKSLDRSELENTTCRARVTVTINEDWNYTLVSSLGADPIKDWAAFEAAARAAEAQVLKILDLASIPANKAE